MKKIIIGIISGAILLGGATFATAASNEKGEGLLNFGQMKPYIQEMHPDLSTQEQKEMFDACHGEEGFMQPINRTTGSMM